MSLKITCASFILPSHPFLLLLATADFFFSSAKVLKFALNFNLDFKWIWHLLIAKLVIAIINSTCDNSISRDGHMECEVIFCTLVK